MDPLVHYVWYQGKFWDSCDTHESVALNKRGAVILDSQLNEIVIIKVKHIFTVFKFARKMKHWGNVDNDS